MSAQRKFVRPIVRKYHVEFIEGSNPATWRVTKIFRDVSSFPQVFDVWDRDVADALSAHEELRYALELLLHEPTHEKHREFARAALARARGES